MVVGAAVPALGFHSIFEEVHRRQGPGFVAQEQECSADLVLVLEAELAVVAGGNAVAAAEVA